MDGCGTSCFSWHPQWMQKFAKTRWFVLVYSLLGTIQSASTTYFNITLTTMERRFRIPSQTTGIILSGNEISQILLSLILTYFGGQKNSPKWIAWGVVCSAISCFILASPHFIYGAGEEALQYTEQNYLSSNQNVSSEIVAQPVNPRNNKLCHNSDKTGEDSDCDEEFSYVPLILIFLSQFVLGIGNTLYYSLGPAYIDNNTKQHNTPLMLSYAYAMRIFGPVIGYCFAYVILRVYIDPTLTPLISKNDPRWMGAWWLGWIIVGCSMFVFASSIGLFPTSLKKETNLEEHKLDGDKHNKISETEEEIKMKENGELKEFSKAIWRLISNKLVMFSRFSSVFYMLGFTGPLTYMGRQMEVQFNKTSSGGSIFTGPMIMGGMAIGTLLSGFILTKYRPKSRYVFFWNIIVGLISVFCTLSYTQLGCGSNDSLLVDGSIISCNSNCVCGDISYSPVCDRSTSTTYYSACHAGCRTYNEKHNIYSDCTCDVKSAMSKFEVVRNISSGACVGDCSFDYYVYSFLCMVSSILLLTGVMAGILLNFRAVEPRDKALGQGFGLFTISLFALIPAPIIFGRIIDSTCLVWNKKCGRQGNCLLYDPIKFRYYMHSSSAFFILIGVGFEFLIWCYAKNLDLYGEEKPKPIKNDKDDSPETQPLNSMTTKI
ncbi:solute carrier organic anion transporter family member 74D-like [Sitodiplosis mosellana]|uniref:solute carrier organic anion transporter family member 74D-like n=1 Tax=Sitodiplosis mosellana TaxID=263140 RepID=UPI002444CD89|nr:solute carrier organic anion transporter family member 74D-like [Sitodiplosis mosellana]XP_055304284.1 solute carrier organic anion transporter family member 74D-like [Sitodiplosis mosellana]